MTSMRKRRRKFGEVQKAGRFCIFTVGSKDDTYKNRKKRTNKKSKSYVMRKPTELTRS